MSTWRLVEACPICDGTGKIYPDDRPPNAVTVTQVDAADELISLALTLLMMHDDPGCSEDEIDVQFDRIREWRITHGDVGGMAAI